MDLVSDITGLLTIDIADKPKLHNWIYNILFPELDNFKFRCRYDTNFMSYPSAITGTTVSITQFSESIFDDFNLYAHRTGIKDWLVAGASWNLCAHLNRVGLVNLASITDINFYSATWSLFDDETLSTVSEQQFSNDNLVTWENCGNGYYKLIGAK